ncbi:putative feruloyl esterase A [Cytospora mali]|uniref:Feruloyl esterase A n=1 Tax=Cytospora mali TaxID=578113 RepID=A0A194UQG1_CYTMA|nr:putative feruloyl esterase A [Valsa mali var. pyri (nom. inval.)]
MRFISVLITACALCLTTVAAAIFQPDLETQYPHDSRPAFPENGGVSTNSISKAFFADLERLARLVDITYCVGTTGISPPFSCASRCKEFPGLELASTWNTGVLMSDSCGYVAVDHGGEDGKGGAVIVAFRGTYSLTNTIVDLSTVPQEYVPYPEPDDGHGEGGGNGTGHNHHHRCTNCTVHMGFLASWTQARKLVLPVLEDVRAEHPGYPIHLVGHSLGGAVALLAALELKVALRWDGMVVTTFGEPQTGNEGFVEFVDRVFDLDAVDGYDPDLERRVYRRVTHMDDPIPLLPLSEWGFRSHAGEVFISKADLSPGIEDLRLCRGDEDPACIAGEDAAGAIAGKVKQALGELSPEERDGDGWLRVLTGLPTRLKLWQLLFAHRDYFWRLGLCVPGGDPSDWGRPPYHVISQPDEL